MRAGYHDGVAVFIYQHCIFTVIEHKQEMFWFMVAIIGIFFRAGYFQGQCTILFKVQGLQSKRSSFVNDAD